MKRLLSLGWVIGFSLIWFSIAQAVPTAVSIDFTGFDGTGFAPSPMAGQLDSDNFQITGLSDGDSAFGDTVTTGDFARGASSGGVGTGGIYAFDVGGGNVALGVQPGGSDMTPGSIVIRTVNNTGSTQTAVTVTYDVCAYNDQPRANTVTFSHSTDNITFVDVPALDFTSGEAADGSPAWACSARTTTVTGLALADGDLFYLSWNFDDAIGGGSRDEFAIDNITASFVDLLAVEMSSVGTTTHRSFLWVAFGLLLFVSVRVLPRRA